MHVCVDDCTRLAYVEVLDDERTTAVCGFLERAIGWFADRGVRVERVMTDNGPAYRSFAHADVCRRLAFGTCAPSPTGRGPTEKQSASSARSPTAGPTAASTPPTGSRLALAAFIDYYNHRRPHRALSGTPPAQRLAERNNLAGTYS